MEGSGYQSGLFSATPHHNDNTSGERAGTGEVLLEVEEDSPSPSPSPSPSSTPSHTPSPSPPDSAAAATGGGSSSSNRNSYDMSMGAVMGLAPPALARPAGEAVGSFNMMSSMQGNMGFNTSSNISTTATVIDKEIMASGRTPSPSYSSLPLFTPLILAPTGNSNNSTITTLVSSSDLSFEKRTRGRPPGSGKRQLLATLGEWFAYSAGGNFTPHVVTIAAGEDVAARIMSFSQKGPRGICILSANGAISNVTLRQPGSSGGTLTYEGRFEILSLSGSFTITESSGVCSRTGGISVSLAGPDGRVVGGGVSGLLLAASPIQVVVGSFLPNTFKEHRKRSNPESPSFSPIPAASGVILTAARPVSQVNPDCEIPASTLTKHNHGESENARIASSVSFHQTLSRQEGLQQSSSEHKPSPDINLSLPGDQ